MNRSLLNKAIFLTVLTAIIAMKSIAQKDHHQYEAPLNAVPADGFYKIALTPEITGRSAQDWKDVRVLDDQSKQVPYLHEEAQPAPGGAIVFKIINTGIDTSRQHYVVIENPTQTVLNELTLEVAQTDANRALTLSGSDDNKTWYALREDFFWDHSYDKSRYISFPENHYRFLRLVFIGPGKLPVKLMSVYIPTPLKVAKKYTPVPPPTIAQKDSGQVSYLELTFDRPYLINRLYLKMNGPKYFHRSALFTIPERAQVMLSSEAQSVSTDALTDKVRFRIYNDDNQPVKIESAQAFQEEKSIVAYLEQGKNYTLTFGDSMAQMPVYDLAFFKDRIGRDIPELGIGPIKKVTPAMQAAVKKERSNQWLLWPILVVLLGGLLYITMKMVKQMGKAGV